MICVLVCTYSIDPSYISKWIGDFLTRRNIRFTGVVVSNGKHNIPENNSTWHFFKGSNENLDFGAYKEAATYVHSENYSTYLILNDTLLLKHNGYMHLEKILNYVNIVEESPYPIMAGKTDAYSNICYSNPWSGLPVHISTFCFMINKAALQFITTVNDIANDIFESLVEVDFNTLSGTNEERSFYLFLTSHLRYDGISSSWYRLKDNSNNVSLLTKKAKCVYMEHRLSGFVGEHGCIVSIYESPKDKLIFLINEQVAKFKRIICREDRFLS